MTSCKFGTSEISTLRGLLRRRGRPEILKHCGLVVLVSDPIALKHASVFVFRFLVRKLRVLLDAEAEHETHMNRTFLLPSPCCNVLPRTNVGKIERALAHQSPPLCPS